MRYLLSLFLLSTTLLNAHTSQASDMHNPAQAGIAWQAYTPQVFVDAKAQNKHIYLYLEAVWCHWCHVMEAETHQDSTVQA